MSNYSSLKATINANVKQNGNQEVTGAIMNSVLNAMVDSLGAGYQYKGVATSATNPGTPDYNVFYLASEAGTYTNFGGIVIGDNEVAALVYNGSWSKQTTGAATAAEVSQLAQKIDEFAQGKFYGYFGDASELPTGDISGFAYVGTEPPFAIYNYNGNTWTDSGLTVNGIPVGNGEDIDFNSDGLLQFANRAYDAQDPDGMGYVILREDRTFTEQVIAENTIYEIRYDFDLNGGSVTIPAGCVLKFVGGTLSNGNLIGNDTRLDADIVAIFDRISISGTWVVSDIYSSWFADLSQRGIKNLTALSSDDIFNTIHICSGTYPVEFGFNFDVGLALRDNTKLILDGELQVVPNGFTHYDVIRVSHKRNIVICGSGTIVGDKSTHTGTEGEYGMGIALRGSDNVDISGLTIKDCWGDCIVFGDPLPAVNKNVYCHDLILTGSRRQGISLCNANHCKIENCVISDIGGTAPESGIDIEPLTTQEVKDVEIVNCKITNCNSHGIMMYSDNGLGIDGIRIDNCVIQNNSQDDTVAEILNYLTKNVTISNTHIEGDSAVRCVKAENTIFRDTRFIATSLIINDDFNSEEYMVRFENCSAECDNIDLSRVNVSRSFLSGGIRIRYGELYDTTLSVDRVVSPRWTPLDLTSVKMFGGFIINAKTTLQNYFCQVAGCIIKDVVVDCSADSAWNLINYLFTKSGTKINVIEIYCTGKPNNNLHDNSGYCVVRDMGDVPFGTTAARPNTSALPSLNSNGMMYFDSSISKPIWWDGTKYIDSDGCEAGIKKSGPFADRPTSGIKYLGFSYFCTDRQTTEGGTDGIMIFYKGLGVWVDALGRVVS